ncbi:MAG TPA: helix-turn-helix transcriptional regulator [Ferruginibacter sp.]|nr:helix-turn-helix transcriptional regulator [Ferruginibacter sp.]
MKSHKEFKPVLVEIGERIYKRRMLKDLTTKQIAPMISLTPEAYRNIEKGESDPSLTTVLLICKALDISVAALMKNILT